MKKKVSILTIVIVFSQIVICQTKPIVPLEVRHITVNEGMPSNKVNGIAEDKFGYLWFGTENGLCRYDGYEIKVYHEIEGDSSSLRGQSIPSVYMDSKQRLWIGVEGLNRYDYEKDNFVRYEPINVQDFGDLYAIMEDYDGKLWLGANKKGIIIFNPEENKFYDFGPEGYDIKCLSRSTVNVIKQDKNGLIWMGSENCGLIIYDPFQNKVVHERYSDDNLFPGAGKRIRTIYIEDNGDVWIGTYDDGMYCFRNEGNHFEHFNIDTEIQTSNRVRAIHKDKFGHFWIGTRGGLYLLNKENNSFLRYAHENNPTSDLSQNSVFNIFEDSKGGIWIGTYSGGVNYMNLYQKAFVSYKAKSNDPYFLNNRNVFCIARDHKNNVWIGTENGGLNYLNRKTGLYTYYMHDPKNKNSILSNNVKEILIDKKDNLWIGTYNGGLSYFNTKNGNFRNYSNKKGCQPCLPSDDVYALLLEKNKNVLWIGTRLGLVRLYQNLNVIKPVTFNGMEISDEITNLYEDNNGMIWIFTTDNIFKYDTRKNEIIDVSYINSSGERIYTVYVDKNDCVWTGGNGGLFCYNPQTDSILDVNNMIKQNIDNIYGILEENNTLWVSSNKGLYELKNIINNPRKFTVKRYGILDGLLNVLFVYNSYYKGDDGEMYFGGVNGLNSFYPENIQNNPIRPNVVLNNLRVFNHSRQVGQKMNKHIILEKTLNTTDVITLLHNENMFTIEFAGIHYAQPSQNKYKYRLLGFNSEWTYTDSKRRHASYNNLPPNEYIFEVYAGNGDDVWSEQPAVLRIDIEPAFWNRMWFKMVIILSFIILVFVIYFYRVTSIRRMNKHLEKIVKERTKEIEEKNHILENQAKELSEKNIILENNKQKIELQARDLENSNKLLQDLNKTKDKFFSIIAHDIKNPFVGILGFCDMMTSRADDLTKSEIRELSETLSMSTKNLYSLLENLLYWARSQTGKMVYSPENINLNDLISRNIDLLKDNLLKKKIELKTIGDLNINIYVDLNMMNTVIQNLLTNAIKFTDVDGTIEISASKKEKKAEICIKDSGIGISKEDLQKLFKIEHSFTKPGTDGEIGTGLGLILCKEFIKNNNGDIFIESELGKGSKFIFTVPINSSDISDSSIIKEKSGQKN